MKNVDSKDYFPLAGHRDQNERQPASWRHKQLGHFPPVFSCQWYDPQRSSAFHTHTWRRCNKKDHYPCVHRHVHTSPRLDPVQKQFCVVNPCIFKIYFNISLWTTRRSSEVIEIFRLLNRSIKSFQPVTLSRCSSHLTINARAVLLQMSCPNVYHTLLFYYYCLHHYIIIPVALISNLLCVFSNTLLTLFVFFLFSLVTYSHTHSITLSLNIYHTSSVTIPAQPISLWRRHPKHWKKS
jgi:hypothetical protein